MSDSNPFKKVSVPQANWWSAAINDWSTEGTKDLVRKGGRFLADGGPKVLENIKSGASKLDNGGLIQEGIQGLSKWVPDDINKLTTEAGRTALSFVKDRKAELKGSELSKEGIRRLNHVKDLAANSRYTEVPSDALNWIRANRKTVGVLAAIGVIIYPCVVSKPLLRSLGFGQKGPRAASAASLRQSRYGDVPANSQFAYLESAGAGGYGAAGVNKIIRVVAIAVGLWVVKGINRG